MSSSTTKTTTATAQDDIDGKIKSLREAMQGTHDSQVNYTYEWRRTQLKTLRRLVTENYSEILNVLYLDLRKEATEAELTEVGPMLHEIDKALSNLKTWMQPTYVASPVVVAPAWSWTQPRPLLSPACLIIGPFNFPFGLCIQPAVGALCAGNPVIIKPSEQCTNTAALLETLVTQYFDKSVLAVVSGAVPETQALLKHSWGAIFFTGSPRVGRIVAMAAAQTLTPTILELGGKNPCFVDESCATLSDAELKVAARRIIWTKFVNAGQTCASIDYLLIHQSVADRLVLFLQTALEEQLRSNGYGETWEMGRMVTTAQAQRMKDYIEELERVCSNDNTKTTTSTMTTKILCGKSDDCNIEERYVCPFLVLNPPMESSIMKEEIFGSLLPIVTTIQSREEAVALMKQLSCSGHSTAPLNVYVYTPDNSAFDSIRKSIPGGSIVQNDGLVHFGNLDLPMGGVGTSGMGQYHGKFGFDSFSHHQAVLSRPLGGEFPLLPAIIGATVIDWIDWLRCHPFKQMKSGSEVKGKFVIALFRLALSIPVLVPQCIRRNKWLVFTTTSVAAVGVAAIVGNKLDAADSSSSSSISSSFVIAALSESLASSLEHIASWLRGGGVGGPKCSVA